MSQFNFIYAEEHLSHREKTVYIYLRDRADASGVCWPGIKTIARELWLSPRTVQREPHEQSIPADKTQNITASRQGGTVTFSLSKFCP